MKTALSDSRHTWLRRSLKCLAADDVDLASWHFGHRRCLRASIKHGLLAYLSIKFAICQKQKPERTSVTSRDQEITCTYLLFSSFI
jgi:hypothetical protein